MNVLDLLAVAAFQMNIDLLHSRLFDDGGVQITVENTDNLYKVGNENLGEFSVDLFSD